MRKIKIKKIKEFVILLPRILARHAFLCFLAFVFLTLVFGAWLFYHYSFLVEKKKIEVFLPPAQKFKEKTYQQILATWQEREKRSKEAFDKIYPNPFLGID